MITLGLDIGSNSVGSAWVDTEKGEITLGVSVFPAGVKESEEKRGEPKNAKRRMARRTRITFARRSERKRLLRLKLIEFGLLPAKELCQSCSRKSPSSKNGICCFKRLLETTDPWELRRTGLYQGLSPFEFGRVLLHLAQRRGALGLHLLDPDEDETNQAAKEEGKVKKAIREVQANMQTKKARTFGDFIAMVRAERVTRITSEDRRPPNKRKGPREWRNAVRNKAAYYEHCADRGMIRCEFSKLWEKQSKLGGETAKLLTPELRLALDNESRDARWRHKGLLFQQRRATWDLGTLGRCNLHPDERCIAHADMYASRYLVVETVNNLKIVERGNEPRPLTPEEREKIKDYLSGPLGMETPRKKKGQTERPQLRPKRTVNVQDLRAVMGSKGDGWGRTTKKSNSRFRFTIENDEDREINTDWFYREIVHGAIGIDVWSQWEQAEQREAHLPEKQRTPKARRCEAVNRAILKFDPDQSADAERLREGARKWWDLDDAAAGRLVEAWKKRPRPGAKRLNMSRRAVRNLLELMDRPKPWPDPDRPGQGRWLTQIEARKLIADDDQFRDVTTKDPFDARTRDRYRIGAKGATSRDRYYMRKHLLHKDGKPIYGPDGLPLHEPPPAPMISNPVVRKAIHEVRRHLIEYMVTFERKPDQIYIELAREARMGKMDADRLLFKNRLRNRIRKEIIEEFVLDSRSPTQQNEAVRRVVLCVQQGGVCPLCGNQGVKTTITERMAANGEDCEIAHIIPRAVGGDNRYTNIVLAHRKCNRDMGRRTPREYWEATLPGGFQEGMQWVERIYGDIQRIKPSETKKTTGPELWKCYLTEPARPKRGALAAKPPNFFSRRFDKQMIAQFKKGVTDIQKMTARQEAATKYATRQVMAYLADALYDGKGLPERGGPRLIYATDGLWTSRLRREWGLFFDPHEARSHGLTTGEEQRRKEKNRGDHRHHAIDAVVIALCTRQVQIAWEEREKRAESQEVDTANEEQMEHYRRNNPLRPPRLFKSREHFREAVRRAVFIHSEPPDALRSLFGGSEAQRPVCHRPIKRKLIGALHKETLQGSVIDKWQRDGAVHSEPLNGRVTVRQNILGETQKDYLKPAHLRMPRLETKGEAVDRLARRFRIGKHGMAPQDALRAARRLVRSKAFSPKQVDPKPEKTGIVRDPGLRRSLRNQLQRRGLNPDSYSKLDLKRSIDAHGPLTQESGVPIHRVVLLCSNSDPVTIRRDQFDYATGQRRKLDDPATYRLYDSQNNHHIEIRVAEGGKWSGNIVTAKKVAQPLLARLRQLNRLEKPYRHLRRRLTRDQRKGLSRHQIEQLSRKRLSEWKQALRDLRPQRTRILRQYPLINQADNEDGRFVTSLCEGEMLLMKHKKTGEAGYFVVAKLDRPQTIVVVPHWDARSATGRKDPDGKEIPDSKREQFAITPTDLKKLAAPGRPHAIKVRVSPLGKVTLLERD